MTLVDGRRLTVFLNGAGWYRDLCAHIGVLAGVRMYRGLEVCSL